MVDPHMGNVPSGLRGWINAFDLALGRKMKILIIGSAGVGKTTLLTSIVRAYTQNYNFVFGPVGGGQRFGRSTLVFRERQIGTNICVIDTPGLELTNPDNHAALAAILAGVRSGIYIEASEGDNTAALRTEVLRAENRDPSNRPDLALLVVDPYQLQDASCRRGLFGSVIEIDRTQVLRFQETLTLLRRFCQSPPMVAFTHRDDPDRVLTEQILGQLCTPFTGLRSWAYVANYTRNDDGNCRYEVDVQALRLLHEIVSRLSPVIPSRPIPLP